MEKFTPQNFLISVSKKVSSDIKLTEITSKVLS